MRGTLVIFRRELKSYFDTPIAYIFLPILLGLMSFFFFFFRPFFAYGQADMRAFFALMPWALFLFAPPVTMRLWSEELRVGTAEILLTLPYKVHELVVGKFLAAFAVLTLAMVLSIGIPLSIGWLGEPDWGPILGGYLGSLLMGAFFIAMGAFISSLTQNQVVALLVGLLAGVTVVLLLSSQSVQFIGVDQPGIARFIESLGVVSHFESFERGILALSDVIYFLGGTVVFLLLNVFAVQARRY